ncbi:MAG TPA: hypothetical protein VMY88_05230 [Acidimicrobiales bacterium]|nr:hypothetical protein [Acidimicrobiales bacterium]
MAFVVRRPKDRWEIREAVSTDSGPRSRTLATFSVLTRETLELARERATTDFDDTHTVGSASRAGAPVQLRRADQLARELLREIAEGERPSVALTQELQAALPDRSHRPEGATWVGSSLEARGETVADLLSAANAFPGEWKPGPLEMPLLRAR